MPRKASAPSYRQRTDRPHLAVVQLTDAKTGKRRTYGLGDYDTPESWETYYQLLAEWKRGGRRLPDLHTNGIPGDGRATIAEVCLAFVDDCERRLTSGAMYRIRATVRILRRFHGSEAAEDFGPKKLKALRLVMVNGDDEQEPLCRKVINDRVNCIRQLFKWAASEEMVSEDVHRRLTTVDGLGRGEHGVEEGRGTAKAERRSIRMVRRLVPLQARALLDLYLLCGARPSELFGLRATDIETTGDVWTVSLAKHKNAKKGKARVIYFGPRSQRILARFMSTDRPVNATLFDPREAGGLSGSRAKHDRYNKDSFNRLLRRACEKAGVDRFTTYSLRHARGTKLREQFGEEGVTLGLGHSHADTARLYGEKNIKQAKRIAKQLG